MRRMFVVAAGEDLYVNEFEDHSIPSIVSRDAEVTQAAVQEEKVVVRRRKQRLEVRDDVDGKRTRHFGHFEEG
jgi:hypothetical protein